MNKPGDWSEPPHGEAEPAAPAVRADDADDSTPSEPDIGEAIDKYLRETHQAVPPSAEANPLAVALPRERTGRRRVKSSGGGTQGSLFEVVRRSVRLSPYMLTVVVATALALAAWSAMLLFAFLADSGSPFAGDSLEGRQRALGLIGLLSSSASALFVRAAWQIQVGTRRHREFPPRKPALLQPAAILRGIDAERIGSLCVYVAMVLVVVSCVLLAATLSVMLRSS